MRLIIFLVAGFLLSGCSGQRVAERVAKQERQWEELKNWVAANYETETTDFTNAFNNLRNNTGDIGSKRYTTPVNQEFLKLRGDTISAAFVQSIRQHYAGEYGRNSGLLKIEGVPENIRLEVNEKKKTFTIRFEVKDELDSYQVTLLLFDNYNIRMFIHTDLQETIVRNGVISELYDKSKSSR